MAGPEVARVLAERGAYLSLGERDAERMAGVAEGLGLPEDRLMTQTVDLTDPESARGWVDATVAKFGRVNVLVHLVGGWRGGKPIAEAPPEDDEFLLTALVRTLQVTSRAFLPALSESGGRVVIVSSPQADRPSRTNAAYGTAKAAAEAWTLALADELGEHGGTANIVRVDVIDDPAIVAEAISFLLSPTAKKMNGQRLSLHG